MNTTEVLKSLALEDGGLIEVYSGPVDGSAWRRFVIALRESGYRFDLVHNLTGANNEEPLPGDWVETGNLGVQVRVGSQLWTSTIPSLDEIVLQGDPREITSSLDLKDVINFMKLIHEITSRKVLLLPETLEYSTTRPYLVVPEE